MKKNVKALLVVACGVLLSATSSQATQSLNVQAMEDFVNENGEAQYGWSVVANETNASVWEFAENGDLSYCYAAEGDTSAQRVNNYALRNLAVEQDDSYTLSCTFIPDADSDLSVERTYGLVCWYQDADNYLLYWLQQKTAGDWSGQFYGRINGAFRKIWVPSEYSVPGVIENQDYWLKGEYYDLWWDQAKLSHPSIVNKRNILLSTTIELKVVSTLAECTVGDETKTCRRFELHQVIDGVDFTSCVFYVEQIDASSGSFYTGVYSECFSVGIEGFNLDCENTDFVGTVNAELAALPVTINSTQQIATIESARVSYERLILEKSKVEASNVTKLESAEAAVGAYVDKIILALDSNKSSFKEDVNAAYDLYSSLSSILQGKVSKVTELSAAINAAKDWVDPNNPNTSDSSTIVPSDSSQPVDSSSNESSGANSGDKEHQKKGCSGDVGTTVGLFGMISFLCIALILCRKKCRK